jgi:signal peptidase I
VISVITHNKIMPFRDTGFEKGIEMTGHGRYRELLDNNPHDILLRPYVSSRSVRITVPEGHYLR